MMAKLLKLIPNVFYTDIHTGLNLFVDCLGFTVVYSEPENQCPFYIVKRDDLQVHLIEDEEFALKDRPEMRIATDDIEGLYQEISAKQAQLLHPNLLKIKQQPWGLKEFALLDKEGTCIIIQQP
ncbi:hypothetical protein FW774_18960 [Pedobacter sp. BS3]|uniref:hypothetical protein n=1 Tax=Pedobacter sp. BS3 TaxID=2567937 RepID=UPI0011ECDC72|nr:hypothetical protein [Pedobacter sp. BS3]TZF81355.1 hypothetical protein FW774_18960 [Pedobacter sp. BS3]